MKYTLLLLSFFFAFSLQAQYKVASFGLSAGVDEDRVQGLSNDYMLNSAGMATPAEIAATLEGASVYSMICENPYFKADVALKNGDKELRLGVYAIINRIDAISSYGSRSAEYVDLTSYGHEVGVEVAHLWRSNKLCGWSLYGGGGTQMGVGFGNYLHGSISSSSTIEALSFRQNGGTFTSSQTVQSGSRNYDYYISEQVPASLHGRAFAMGGASFNIRRIEFSLEGRWGYGFRQNKHAGAITNLRSIHGGIRYNLRRPGPCGDRG